MILRDYYNFLLGGLTAISIMALHSDYLGLEGYIKKLKEPGGWLEPKYSVPLYSVILIFCVICLFNNNKEKMHKTKVITIDANNKEVSEQVDYIFKKLNEEIRKED